MLPNLFFYQLVLVALVWLGVLLHWAWPSDCAPAHLTPSQPTPQRHKRRREPKPFAGVTHKPHCDTCAHAGELRSYAPLAPPRIVTARGRRRAVDTAHHFCPNADCAYHGWVGWGNLRANGHPNGGPWRQLLCVVCRRYFLETLGTLFHGKRVSVELIVRVIACVAEGLGIRGTARVFEVDPHTVLQWLVDAAAQLQAFSRHVLHDVRVRQVQLDELFALLSAVKAGAVSQTEALERLERTPQWVWVAMDPESKLVLAIDVGERTLALAQRVVHQVVQVLAACGWQINTAFIERLNLSMRQHVAALGRRVTTLCKHEDGLRQQLALYHVYYNFCLPHASLHVPLPQPLPTNGTGSAKTWRPRTPAMAAGLTDRVWTLREVLLFRVPPWPQPVGV